MFPHSYFRANSLYRFNNTYFFRFNFFYITQRYRVALTILQLLSILAQCIATLCSPKPLLPCALHIATLHPLRHCYPAPFIATLEYRVRCYPTPAKTPLPCTPTLQLCRMIQRRLPFPIPIFRLLPYACVATCSREKFSRPPGYSRRRRRSL